MQPVRRLRHKGHTGEVSECIAVVECNCAPLPDAQIENFELPSSNASQYIAQPVVVAYLGMFVGETGIARLGGPEACLCNPLRIAGYQHAASGSSDDLVAIEREHADVAHGTGLAAFVQRP